MGKKKKRKKESFPSHNLTNNCPGWNSNPEPTSHLTPCQKVMKSLHLEYICLFKGLSSFSVLCTKNWEAKEKGSEVPERFPMAKWWLIDRTSHNRIENQWLRFFEHLYVSFILSSNMYWDLWMQWWQKLLIANQTKIPAWRDFLNPSLCLCQTLDPENSEAVKEFMNKKPR